VCSGIEAASCAWRDLGWSAAAFAEIEAFPSAVLAHHFPEVPNLGDFTRITAGDIGPIDLLVGGTPCQSFSVAGKRTGMDDPRGVLAFEFIRLAQRTRPRWVVFENVPGLLSSRGGADFGDWLTALVECGYGWAYRVLDAQHFGVPQRRRRIFVVGYLGDWRPPAAVLLEPESMRGDSPPSREAREGIARPLASGHRSSGGYRNDADTAENLITHSLRAVAPALTARSGKGPDSDATTALVPFASHVTQDPISGVTSPAMGTGNRLGCGTIGVIAFDENQITSKENGSRPEPGNNAPPLVAYGRPASIASNLRGRDGGAHMDVNLVPAASVRRLTPRECERLQGFLDDWTLVPYRGKPATDGPRYRAIGNSMAVPVVSWVGQRIALCESVRVEGLLLRLANAGEETPK